MADATDSKSVGRNTVWVQVPYPAPIKNLQGFNILVEALLFYINIKKT